MPQKLPLAPATRAHSGGTGHLSMLAGPVGRQAGHGPWHFMPECVHVASSTVPQPQRSAEQRPCCCSVSCAAGAPRLAIHRVTDGSDDDIVEIEVVHKIR